MSRKDVWSYGAKQNPSTIEVYSHNEFPQGMRTDEYGEFYDVDVDTNDNQYPVLKNGKQFRVYTNGRISQRIGMKNLFEERLPPQF